jgi:hypothetical protein
VRRLTAEEHEQWSALIGEHGLCKIAVTDEPSADAAGIVEIVVRVVTPLGADDHTETLERKTSPILFDRTPDGGVRVPWRWWQRWFERLGASNRWSADVARRGEFEDCVLPATTDTVAMVGEDATGAPLTWEVLPPGTLLTVRVRLPEAGVGA